jgi:hypothetical protein
LRVRSIFSLSLCAGLLTLPVSVSAQPLDSRSTVSAIGGFGKTYDDEGSLGGGWLAGGAFDRVVFGRTRAEVSLEVLTHDRDAGYFQSRGRTIVTGVSLLRRFGNSRAQPYLFGGLTAGHHSGTNVFDGSPVERSSLDAGMRFGAGVAIRAGRRLELSPEFRLNGFFIDNGADPATLLSFGLRVGWRR